MAEEIVTISKKEYDQLKHDSLFLECLQEAGVDNWEGYYEARKELNKIEGKEENSFWS